MLGLSLPSFIFEPRGSFAELKMSARLARGRKRKLAETTVADVETKEDTPAVAPFTHWLMKSEPDSRIEKGVEMKFSFEDLKAMPSSTSCWDGVRNYQARNFMREMRTGQLAFFYHSNVGKEIVGIVEVAKEAYPDPTAEIGDWVCVDMKAVAALPRRQPIPQRQMLPQQRSARACWRLWRAR